MTPERIAELRAWRAEGDPTRSTPDLAAWFLQLPGNLDEMLDEIERLRRWKAEATEVIARWEDVALLVPFDSSTLGQSKADVVKNEIERLRAELAALRDEFAPGRWLDSVDAGA